MSASPLGPDWHPAGNAADFEDEVVNNVCLVENDVEVALFEHFENATAGGIAECLKEKVQEIYN
jgi:hypothetical protein